jgi:hypothetical protein
MKTLAAIKAKGVPACRRCQKRPARDCGKLNFDPWNGDFDCDDPEALDDAGGSCDDCLLTYCEQCAAEVAAERKRDGKSARERRLK